MQNLKANLNFLSRTHHLVSASALPQNNANATAPSFHANRYATPPTTPPQEAPRTSNTAYYSPASSMHGTPRNLFGEQNQKILKILKKKIRYKKNAAIRCVFYLIDGTNVTLNALATRRKWGSCSSVLCFNAKRAKHWFTVRNWKAKETKRKIENKANTSKQTNSSSLSFDFF